MLATAMVVAVLIQLEVAGCDRAMVLMMHLVLLQGPRMTAVPSTS